MRIEVLEELDLPTHKFRAGSVVDVEDKELLDRMLASGKARPAVERAVKAATPETHDRVRSRRVRRKTVARD